MNESRAMLDGTVTQDARPYSAISRSTMERSTAVPRNPQVAHSSLTRELVHADLGDDQVEENAELDTDDRSEQENDRETRRPNVIQQVAGEARASANVGVPERNLMVLENCHAGDFKQRLLIVPVPESPVLEVNPNPTQKKQIESE